MHGTVSLHYALDEVNAPHLEIIRERRLRARAIRDAASNRVFLLCTAILMVSMAFAGASASTTYRAYLTLPWNISIDIPFKDFKNYLLVGFSTSPKKLGDFNCSAFTFRRSIRFLRQFA